MLVGWGLLLLSGVCQGTFGLGYKNYKPFTWNVFWFVYNILGIITSTIFAFITAPKGYIAFLNISPIAFVVPLLCGVIWGASAICFSKGITMIGMSMVYGLSMGISTVVGSVVPMWMNNNFPHGLSALWLWVGLGLTIIGVIIITKGGIIRDKSEKFSKIGIIFAMLSGLGSGAMNIGFNSLKVLESEYQLIGYSDYSSISAGKWLPILVGGCLTGAIYCLISALRTRSISTLKENGAVFRWWILFFVSIIWYLALFLYGCAEKNLGQLGSSIGWIIFNALSLLISSGIGLKMGEWNKNKKAKSYLLLGNSILILSWLVIVMV